MKTATAGTEERKTHWRRSLLLVFTYLALMVLIAGAYAS